MPLSVLDQVGKNFDDLTQSGKQGSELVDITKSAIHQMVLSVTLFETGMSNETWKYNFSTFAGSEGTDTAVKILMIFKDTLNKLKQIPLEELIESP